MGFVAKESKIGILVAFCVTVLDQVTKFYVSSLHVGVGEIRVCEFCNLVGVWNRGISFGMFDGFENGNLIFAGLSLVVILALSIALLTLKKSKSHLEIGMIIGGACGNLVDRFRYGAVYDFIDLHLNRFHWPAFNIADVFVVFGVLGVVLTELSNRGGPSDVHGTAA